MQCRRGSSWPPGGGQRYSRCRTRRTCARGGGTAQNTPALPPAPQDAPLSFHLHLESGARLFARIYLVYDEPPTPYPARGAAGSAGTAALLEPAELQQCGEGGGDDAAPPSPASACGDATQYGW